MVSFNKKLYLFLVVSLVPCLSLADTTHNIEGIVLEGNRKIDTSAIKIQLSHQKGQVSDAQISEEVKALYKTGFFNQVTASVVTTDSKPAKTVIKYSLVEKPVVRKVFIQGNKEVEESDLKEIFKFGTERFLDRTKTFFLIKNAISLYQSKGFFDATFDYNVVPVGENQVDLVLTVKEGQRYKIREISFKGTKEIDEDDLIASIQTKRYKWWNSWLYGTGRLNQEMLENDRSLIRQYFLDHGFVDGSIGDPVVEAKDGDIKISFNIEEGRKYKIGALTTSGDKLDTGASLIDKIKSKSGDDFSAAQIREDAFSVSDKFTDIGYAFANVQPDTQINRDLGLLDIDFGVNKGKLVKINRINIRGNNKTYDRVIRRELKVDEQDLYSSSKVKRSQQLLERTGYFEETNITSEPADQDDKVNLLVNVKEGSTGTFSAGAGFSSSDGLLFNSRITENNLFGTGRSVSISGDLGTQRDNVELTLQDRRLWDSYWSGTANAFRSFREYSDFNRILTGGSLEFGYPLEEVFGESFDDIAFYTEYQYTGINISHVDPREAADLVIQSQGHSTSSAVTPKLIRNTINNPLDPKNGSKQVLSVEASGLGGTEKYYLIEARNQWYTPLFDISDAGSLVFSWRTAFGYGKTYDGDPFPLFKRYFPGGINSVRGFRNRRLGPKDSRGNEYGGSKELINNLELIFPLVKSAGLKGVVFYDVGQAYDDNDTINLSDLRHAYGFGLRWMSPLGPLRVEFGIPLDRESGESSLVTLFSFGAPL